MTVQHLELAQRWLERADHDIITAQQTLLLVGGPTDTPCFHAQQAIEKALKAFLTAHQVAFPRTHDLLRVLDLTLVLMPDLDAYREQFADMKTYEPYPHSSAGGCHENSIHTDRARTA
jgi:HEPN domain-containing protein